MNNKQSEQALEDRILIQSKPGLGKSFVTFATLAALALLAPGVHAMAAGRRVKEEGLPNDLLERVAGDAAFRLDLDTLDRLMDPRDYTGLAQQQVEDYLAGEAARALEGLAHLDSPQARVNL